ncbi:MAG: ATP-dependent zinc metalloprotease FtsH [Candidatus Geothermincolia bacterium]
MEEQEKKRRWIWLIYILLALALIVGVQVSSDPGTQNIDYSDFLERLDEGQIRSVSIGTTSITGTYQGGEEEGGTDFTTNLVPNVRLDELILELREKGVVFTGRVDNNYLRDALLSWVLPIGVILLIWIFLFRRVSQRVGAGGGGALQFGQTKARIYDRSKDRVTFDEVAGLDEAKTELQEIIDFLKNPQKYRRLGARIPKGVLLVGPPGTGKTLLARAVAGEADVPFFTISGGQFVEMFVRDLFEQAKAKAPCIVFIDEIDTVGKVRGGISSTGGTEEREQTLNQLLNEMDGFDPQAGVIILAATNRPDVLDPAITRPGRFDRQIAVDRPDIRGREEILKVHLRQIKMSKKVDLKTLAARTPGFAGADLANVVNEAALLAARRDKHEVDMADFEEAIDRVVGGLERKSRILSEKERQVVAHHEVGHALVASLVEYADPVHRITVIPRGVAALGMTQQLPEEDRYIVTQPELLDRIAVLMGGRAAEEVVFGQISTGAQSDLEKATIMARRMVESYGMSKALGPVSLGERGPLYLRGEFGFGSSQEYSEATAELIDGEIKSILEENYSRVHKLVLTEKATLQKLASALLERETMEGEDFRQLLREEQARRSKRPATKKTQSKPA